MINLKYILKTEQENNKIIKIAKKAM